MHGYWALSSALPHNFIKNIKDINDHIIFGQKVD